MPIAPVPPAAQPARVLQPVHRHGRSTPIDWSPPEVISRALAISAVAAIALIHLLDAPDTYSSTRYIFWLYIALVAAGMPVITMLMRWRSSSVWIATAALATGPLVGYIVSRSIGLPGDPNDVGNWLNSLGMASLLIEALLIALSISRLRLLAQAAALSSRRSLSVTAWSAAAPAGRPSNQSRRRMAVSHLLSTTNHRSLMPHSLLVRRSILLAVALLTAALAMFALQGSPASAAGTQVPRLSAKAHMVLRFSTSRLHAHPGRITIIMTNPSNAGMKHGIAVQGHGVDRDGPIVSPGHNSTVTVTLSTKGMYVFYCPVPGHKQAGMKGVLTIS